jgi:O-antigen/teichoic acid export membrane protein
VVFSGNTLAYVISFVFTPFIARIYTPEAYGAFSLFIAINSNLLLLGSMGYAQALVLPRTQQRFIPLLQLCLLLAFAVALLLFVLTALWGKELLLFLKAPDLIPIRFLIPLLAFISAVSVIWQGWNMRLKEFRRGAASRIFSTLISRLITLGWGLLRTGNLFGLVLGELFFKASEVLSLPGRRIRQEFAQVFTKPRWLRLLAIARFYKGYPLFTLPAMWLSLFKGHIPVYVLSYFFDIGLTGQFAYATALLTIPLTLIANSTSPVFLQRATELYQHDAPGLSRLVLKFASGMLYLGLLPFGLLTVFGDWIFVAVLGDQWETAGAYAGIMGVFYLFFVIANPLTTVYRVLHMERYILLLNGLNVALIVVLLIPGLVWRNAYWVVIGFSMANVFASFFNFMVLFKALQLNSLKFVLKAIGLTFLCFGGLLAVRLLLVAVLSGNN